MRLRKTHNGKTEQVEAKYQQQWIPLARLNNLDALRKKYHVKRDLSKSIIGVLELGNQGWSELQNELAVQAQSSINNESPPRTLLLPFKPRSFRDFMLFEDHVVNSTRGYVQRFMPGTYRITKLIEVLTRKPFHKFFPHKLWYKQPIYYFGNHLNFVTENDTILWPSYTKALDYELELGAILAKPIINASVKEVNAAIGGYVILNDISARDIQKDEMESGFGPQRAKHFINSLSAEVITADEAQAALIDLQGSVSINGIKVSACKTTKMQFSLAEAIAFVSQNEQLHSGELFGTGTIPGGSGLENGHWIKPGDKVTLSIDGIGSISNNIQKVASGGVK